MAERRMVSKVISISEKVNSLSLFGRLLYTWMIPHTDDFGRMPGSPAKVKALVVPMADETRKDVEEALSAMDQVGVIQWYEVNGEKYVQITNFDEHQSGLNRRTASKIPPPPFGHGYDEETKFSLLEADIEELIHVNLCQNTLINEMTVVNAERQVRIQNSYIDILASTDDSQKIIVEVKRQKLSNAAIDQIVKYREMLDTTAKCVLIGFGLSANFDHQKAADSSVNVLVYDENLVVSQVTLIDVNCRQITLHAELNRTELELNRNTATTTCEDESTTEESFPATYERVNQRSLTPYQAEVLGKYIDDEGFEESVLVRAIERAGTKGAGISLVLKILNDYAAGGAKTLQAATAFDTDFEKGKSPPAVPLKNRQQERTSRAAELRRRAEEGRLRDQG